jgi:RNA polymerase sigma-70 factor (ECF subfamily)
MKIQWSKDELESLVAKAKNGDSSAFAELYNCYFSPIFRFIYWQTKSRTEAEDLTQTVFLKALKNLSGFKNKQGGGFSAWVYAIARNTVIDHWRKKKEIFLNDDLEKSAEPVETDTPLKIAEKEEIKSTLHQIVMKLNPGQKEVVILKFVEGLSTKEIGNLLGKSEDAIRQLQCRGLKTIRQHLKNLKLM